MDSEMMSRKAASKLDARVVISGKKPENCVWRRLLYAAGGSV